MSRSPRQWLSRTGYTGRLAILTIFVGFLLPATGAFAACSQWSVQGAIILRQSNNTTVRLQLEQNGSSFSGLGSFPQDSGTVTGSIVGQRFNATVQWRKWSVGVYTAVVVDAGNGYGRFQDGRTYDRLNPGSFATWSSSTNLSCISTGSQQFPNFMKYRRRYR